MNPLFALICLCLWTRIANQQIYQSLQDTNFCFRRLNATHESGCQSDANGNTGIVYLVEGDGDIEWITQHSPVFPLIPVLPLSLFTTKTLKTFAASDRVTGVIVIKRAINQTEDPVPKSFSPETSCPNDGFGMYREDENPDYAHCQKQQWVPANPVSDLMSMSLPFPMFYLTLEDSIDRLLSCYETYNRRVDGQQRPWPLCAAQLKSLMHAAVHTPKCMSRSDSFAAQLDGSRFCDPLSSRNVFTYLTPRGHQHHHVNRSIVFVVARLDSMSLFDETSHGAESAITGIVALLSVARTLASAREEIERNQPKKEIVFAIFDGEAFDYIGSSASVFDMERAKFPQVLKSYIKPANITLSTISHVIELNQLVDHSSGKGASLFLHSDPVTRSKSSEVEGTLKQLLQIIQNVGVLESKEASKEHGLPPSSVQSFLRSDPGIVGLHISNHETGFTNPYYNSLLDSIEQISSEELETKFTDYIAKVATVVSRSLFKLITGKDAASSLTPEKDLIKQMLHCLLINNTCSLFQQVAPEPIVVSSNNYTTPLYVSVIGNQRRQLLVNYMKGLMLYLTGESVSNATSADKCVSLNAPDQKVDGNNLYEYYWLLGKSMSGECVRGSTFVTSATSPAFQPGNENWSSTRYSTWTESVWTSPQLRIFLKPNPAMEWFALLSGSAITIASFVIVFLVNQHSKTLFRSEPSSRASIDRTASEIST